MFIADFVRLHSRRAIGLGRTRAVPTAGSTPPVNTSRMRDSEDDKSDDAAGPAPTEAPKDE